MKKILFLALCCVAVRLLAVAPVPFTESVGYSFKINGTGSATMTVYDESGSPYLLATASGSLIESSTGTAWLRPGKTYSVCFWGYGPPDYWMSFVAPLGYTVYVNGVAGDLVARSPGTGWFLHYHTVELRPARAEAGGLWGSFSGIALGKSITWSVGLGDLRTGRSAGAIQFKEVDLSNNPISRERLYYAAPPANVGQIVVIKDGPSNQTLRQLVTPVGFTDIVDDFVSSVQVGYTFKFYSWGQVSSWNGTIYTFSGSPWKTIKVESPGSSQLKITETEGSVVRVSNLVASSSTSATGGTVSAGGGYTMHTFNSSGTFTVSGGISSVDYLVVAGGGGGGGGVSDNGGGGGGGGGVLAGSMSVSNTAYTVTVGAGGNGGTAGTGAAGGNSSFAGSVTAVGGGFGGAYSGAAGSGGSGGGAGRDTACCGGPNTSGQGYTGGNGGAWSWGSAGGGGGAGGAGNHGGTDDSARSSGTAADGGIGVASSISGTSTYYAGGGAGAWQTTTTPSGGLGGGGYYPGYGNAGNHATPNTGGGGSGAQFANGGNGGSGVVIIRYPGDPNNFTWTLTEGDGTTVLRTTKHTSSVPTSGQRDDVVEVRTGTTAGTVVAKTKYHYVTKAWGEELVQVIADPDSSNPAERTTTYDYWATSTDLGNYRRVKSVTEPTGNWTAYEYYNDYDTRGQLKYEYHPYLDSPSTVQSTLDPTSGRVVYLTYTADWTTRHTRPTLREERINNTVTGKTTWSHGDATGSGEPRAYATINSYRDASNYHSDYAETYRTDADPDFAGQLYQAKGANLAQISGSISRGTFNTTTKAFAVSSGGDHWRELKFNGSTSSTGADAVTSFDSQSCPSVYLIPNKSTLNVTIRIAQGYVYRTETWVYNGGGNFYLVSHEDWDYDGYGHLTQRWASNGALTNHTFTNGRLVSTLDSAGTESTFTYDEIGRPKTSVKKGASASGSYAAQGDITTTYTYDGANHVTQTVSSGGSLSLTASSTYDLAGRMTGTTAPGGYTTSFAYSSGGRVVTTTLPGGATQIAETHYDGQPKSQTGTAVVAQAVAYTLNTTPGTITRKVSSGSSTAHYVETTTDWLGRPITETKPKWGSGTTTRTWTYANTGLLTKLIQPGLADTLYSHDTLGELFRTCLDVGANGTIDLSTSDRITEFGWTYYTSSGNWWLQQTTNTYASASSGTSTLVRKVATQISGLPTNRFSVVNTIDIFGNVTSQYVDVNRSGKLVTTTTDVPDSTTDAVSIAYNGLPVSSRSTANLTTTFGYDALGRPTTSVDPRTGTSTTAYVSGTSQVSTVTDPASIVQATYTYDSAGRVSSVKDALNKYAYTSYTTRGEVYRQWGDTAVPVEYAYDTWGRRITMNTYRAGSSWTSATWPGSPGTADATTWNFHEATGLLSSKTDAATKSVSYTYTDASQLATRTWARGTVTTYGYSSTTGERLTVDYGDSTPDLTYTYNRLGNAATVTDVTGTRTFNYNLAATLELQNEDLPSFFGSRRVTYGYASSGVIGRPNALQLGTSGSPTADQSVTYAYDTYGRFNSLAAGGQTFAYGYASNSNLLASITDSASGWTQTRTYLTARDLLDEIETKVSTASKAKFDYDPAGNGTGLDALGRRTVVAKTGEIYNRYGNGTEGLKTYYGYDDRSQVTSEVTKVGTSTTVLTGRDDGFAYDTMGNRSSTSGTNHNGNTANYTTNALNQYTQRSVPGIFDVAGAAGSGTTVTVNGSNTGVSRHGEYFFKGHALTNTSNAVATILTISDGTNSSNLYAFLALTPEPFTYDLDGNLTSDGRWDYTYDAENRLVSMQTHTALSPSPFPNADARRLEFKYDYLGRRVEKIVRAGYNGSSYTTVVSDEKFVCHGWNLMAKLNALSSNALVA
ncbi:MAG: hypothetical protein PSU94_06905, partial [Lacunisphaera sp.]|nr:hypothetical protein [Lacunisphaera sp.]